MILNKKNRRCAAIDRKTKETPQNLFLGNKLKKALAQMMIL